LDLGRIGIGPSTPSIAFIALIGTAELSANVETVI
jgi:hypothetical protein